MTATWVVGLVHGKIVHETNFIGHGEKKTFFARMFVVHKSTTFKNAMFVDLQIGTMRVILINLERRELKEMKIIEPLGHHELI